MRMAYEVILPNRILRDLRKIPRVYADRILYFIASFKEEPRPEGCKKMKGYENKYRLRIADYRIVYTIEDSIKIVEIYKVGHRKDVYKEL